MTERLRILNCDVLAGLAQLPDQRIHVCVTSPPYWQIRDYQTGTWEGGSVECDHKAPPKGGPEPARYTEGGAEMHRKANDGQYRDTCPRCGARRIDKQLGLEARLDCGGVFTGLPCGSCWVCNLVRVFGEVRRVLRKDGTCWVNVGDRYAASGGERAYGSSDGATGRGDAPGKRIKGLAPKQLCMQPFRLALALQADGWWIRSICPWVKRSAMPSSVTDRPSEALEYMILMSRSASYFWDADAVRKGQLEPHRSNGKREGFNVKDVEGTLARACLRAGGKPREYNPNGRNLRNSDFYYDTLGMILRDELLGFDVNPEPLAAGHYAAYPTALVRPCVLASTSQAGCCPKCGAGWRRVAEKDTTIAEQRRGTDGYKSGGQIKGKRFATETPTYQTKVQTLGWQLSCSCPHTAEDCVPATVLDPFAGSGSTLLAALQLGRNALGIELSSEYCDIARQRCAGAEAQGVLEMA